MLRRSDGVLRGTRDRVEMAAQGLGCCDDRNVGRHGERGRVEMAAQGLGCCDIAAPARTRPRWLGRNGCAGPRMLRLSGTASAAFAPYFVEMAAQGLGCCDVKTVAARCSSGADTEIGCAGPRMLRQGRAGRLREARAALEEMAGAGRKSEFVEGLILEARDARAKRRLPAQQPPRR